MDHNSAVKQNTCLTFVVLPSKHSVSVENFINQSWKSEKVIVIIIKYKEKGIMPVSPAHYNDQILH